MQKTDQNPIGPIIDLKDINYSYFTGGVEYHALQNINLQVYPGEYVAILGASGSGKSTLMNILGTLSQPTSGKMYLKNNELNAMDEEHLSEFRNRELGFIFQQFHLLPRLTVLQNVLLSSQFTTEQPHRPNFSKEYLEQRALDLLTKLGIGDQALKLPVNLSGGQKQRVAIARALLMQPSLILADEPTGALDSKSTEEVLNILESLHKEGNTIMIITHDPMVAQRAGRQIKISDGEIIEDTGVNILGQHKMIPIVTEKKSQKNKFVLGIKTVMESLAQVWRSMMATKLRTGLTALGLIIGVMSIVITFTLSEAAKDVILKIFDQAGADKVYVGFDHRQARTLGVGRWQGIHLKAQLKDLEKAMEPYGKVVPMYDTWGEKPIQIAGKAASVSIDTVKNLEDFAAKGITLDKGRFFQPEELNSAVDVAIVGSKFAKKYYSDDYEGWVSNPNFPIGERFYMRGNVNKSLVIIGVLNQKDAMFDRDPNEVVYLPLNGLINNASSPYATWFAVLPDSKSKARDSGEALANILRMFSSAKTPFRVEVPEETIGKIMSFIKVFQGLTLLVGGLCILVGGIGIMNIMLVTITERIKEIGLIKALGATPKAVRNQFLQECSMLCFISGGIAIGLSLLFCNLVVLVASRMMPQLVEAKPLVDMFAISLGLFTSLIAGFVFGMLPAAKAANLDPSEALRSE